MPTNIYTEMSGLLHTPLSDHHNAPLKAASEQHGIECDRRGLDALYHLSVSRFAMSSLAEDLDTKPVFVGVASDLILPNATPERRRAEGVFQVAELDDLDVRCMILTHWSRVALDLNCTPKADGTAGGGIADLPILGLYRIRDLKERIVHSSKHDERHALAMLSYLVDLLVEATGPARTSGPSGGR